MRARLLPVFIAFALVACTAPATPPLTETGSVIRAASASASAVSSPHAVSFPSLFSREFRGTDFAIGSVISRADAYERRNVTYRSDGLRISGIMNIPHGDGPFPVLVLAHGYIDPAVYVTGRGLRREQDWFARRGFAVLHVDYRNHAASDKDPENDVALRLGYVADVINAVGALRESGDKRFDMARVALMGHSMGGGAALGAIIVKPDLVRSVVLMAPVSADASLNVDRWIRPRPELSLEIEKRYGDIRTNPEFWNNISAQSFLDRVAVPVLIHHGTADKDVPVAWSQDLAARLEKAGKNVTLRIYPDEPHEFVAAWTTVMEDSLAFFRASFDEKVPPWIPTDAEWSPPIARFSERVTLKPFGINVTPTNSPVSPERFSGWHTGADFELLTGEDEPNIAISAACDGAVLRKGPVDGYGGVLVQACKRGDEDVTVLYGHIRLDENAPNVGERLQRGQRFAVLGEGFSSNTDGERPHLHFAVRHGKNISLLGYVDTSAQLAGWFDPLTLLK